MFVPSFAHFNDDINLRIALEGKGYQTKCTDIYLSNDDQSLLLKGEAMINHWNEKNNLFLFGNLSQLDADKEGISWLIQNLTGKANAPDILQRIGDISFNGDISGYLNQLTTHGTLLT